MRNLSSPVFQEYVSKLVDNTSHPFLCSICSDVNSGSISLPWPAVKANLAGLRHEQILTLQDSAGEDWDFTVYDFKPSNRECHLVRLTGSSAFLAHHKLKPGDVIVISKATVRKAIGCCAWRLPCVTCPADA